MLRRIILIVIYMSVFMATPALADESELGALCEQALSGVTVHDTLETAKGKLSSQFQFKTPSSGHKYKRYAGAATYDKWNVEGVYSKPKEGDVLVSFSDRTIEVVSGGIKKEEHRTVMSANYIEMPSIAPTSEWPAKHASLAKFVEKKLAVVCDSSRNNVPPPKHAAGRWATRIKQGNTVRNCKTFNASHGVSVEVEETTKMSDTESYICVYSLSLATTSSNKTLFSIYEQLIGYRKVQVDGNQPSDEPVQTGRGG